MSSYVTNTNTGSVTAGSTTSVSITLQTQTTEAEKAGYPGIQFRYNYDSRAPVINDKMPIALLARA